MNRLDLKENTIHGTKDFPVALYLSHWNIPYQWHDEEEIIYVIDGKLSYHIDEEVVTLMPGDCAICEGRHLHSMFLKSHQKVSFFALLFDKSYLFPTNDACHILFKNTQLKHHLSSTIEKEQPAITLIKKLCEVLTTKQQGYQLETKMLLMQFYDTLFHNHLYINASILPYDNTNNNLMAALGYMHSHYDQKISVDLLAQITGYSSSYFETFFKQYTGKTPIEYLILYRLKKASEMLISTEYSILEIASSCGFPNTSYFIKKFKEFYNKTPHQYRS